MVLYLNGFIVAADLQNTITPWHANDFLELTETTPSDIVPLEQGH